MSIEQIIIVSNVATFVAILIALVALLFIIEEELYKLKRGHRR